MDARKIIEMTKVSKSEMREGAKQGCKFTIEDLCCELAFNRRAALNGKLFTEDELDELFVKYLEKYEKEFDEMDKEEFDDILSYKIDEQYKKIARLEREERNERLHNKKAKCRRDRV